MLYLKKIHNINELDNHFTFIPNGGVKSSHLHFVLLWKKWRFFYQCAKARRQYTILVTSQCCDWPFSRSVIQYCSSSLIAVAMRVRPKICIKYSKLSPFSQHPIECSLTYFDPELYVFYSPNWYFYHFYVNQCFRADATMFRNSNFVVFLAHEKMKKQQDTYQNCRNRQYTAKKSPVRPDS